MKLIVKKEGELLDYLYNNLDMPKKRIKQYLMHGSIYVNNNKTTKYNYPLVNGMTIVIDTENNHKKSFPFEILMEDEHLLIINKPSGLQIFSKNQEKEKSLYYIVKSYLEGKNNKVFLIHSQDKDTSGIVIFAKDEKTKKRMKDNYFIFQEAVAIVEGKLSKKEDKIIQYLKENKSNKIHISKDKDGKEAITNYKVIKNNDSLSYLELRTETNHKAQMRVALSSIKHPIVGDKIYGNNNDNQSRLYLHVNRIKFYYPEIRKELLIEVTVPKEIKRMVK